MTNRFSRWAVALATVGVLLAAGPLARAQSADDSGWPVGQGATDSAPASDAAQPADNASDTSSDAAPSSDSGNSEAVASASGGASASAQYPDRDPSALTDFRPALDPYGTWVTDPTYGTVWVPSASYVGSNFAPYVTSGHWGLTASGDWIWVSNYPFGWVVFHYGRWVWISGTGWSWVPGRRYSNAWVVWRVPDDGYDYIGWAPMPPAWGWYNGVAVSLWFGPPVPYVFCDSDYVFYPHVWRHIVHDRRDIDRIAHHTRHWRGPRGSGPSPHRAHVPASAVPSHHTPANPRAVAASHSSPYRISGHGRQVERVARPSRLVRPRTLSSRRPQGTASRTLGSGGFARPRAATMRPVRLQAPRATSRSYGYRVYRPSRTYRVYRPSRSYQTYRPSRSWTPHYSRSYTPSRSSSSYRPAPMRSFSVHRSAPSFRSYSPPTMHFHSMGRGGFHGRR